MKGWFDSTIVWVVRRSADTAAVAWGRCAWGASVLVACATREAVSDERLTDSDVVDTDPAPADSDGVLPMDPPLDRFPSPTLISDTPGNSRNPALAACADGSVWLAWHDFSSDPAGLWIARLDGTSWQTSALDLHTGKSIRPTLACAEDTLHLAWDSPDSASAVNAVWLSQAPLGSFPPEFRVAQRLGTGDRARIAVRAGDPDARVVAVDGSRLVAWNGAVREVLPLLSPNVFGHANGFEDGVWTVFAAGGEGREDIAALRNVGSWVTTWLFTSAVPTSNEVDAWYADSGSTLVWTEQGDENVGAFDVVLREPSGLLTWITHDEPGSFDPVVVVAPDGRTSVAWGSDDFGIWVDRSPFGTAEKVSDDGLAPQFTVDSDGYTHLVWSHRVDGVLQIAWTTDRP